MQDYPNKSIIVFDIETIPDTDIAESLTGKQSQTEEEKREDIYNYHLETTSNPFPRQPFHKVITCSVLRADFTDEGIKIIYLGSCSIDKYNEKEIVEKFFNLFENKNKQKWLVSFNGRTFDLPVLKYRAMLYNIECAGHYKVDYYYRYSWQSHCDLLEQLSDYGASARIKMQELCVLFRLPGKLGMSGDKVAGEYDKGNIKLIKEYCEIDVVNTYLIFLRYIHHRNVINSEYYNHSIENVTKYLKDNWIDREYLKTFYDAWTKIDSNIS